jgi:hypothetical protein
MASTLSFIRPIWVFDSLTDITRQNLPHLSARVLYIKGVCYFCIAFFTSCMTQGKMYKFNPLNTELNPTCHLLILLGDITFMGKFIVSIWNKIQCYTVYLYLETALHVLGGTSTHHQERIQMYLQHLVFVRLSLLSAALSWNQFECAVGGVLHPQHTQTGSNSSTIASDGSNGVTNTRCCRYSCMRS